MQTSDHYLLLLDSKPQGQPTHKRFYFDKRLLELLKAENVISSAWNKTCRGTPIFQVTQRIKETRLALIKLHGAHQMNPGKAIREVKNRMEALQLLGGARDWNKWTYLQVQLDEAYKREEAFWHKKSRI